MSSQARQEMSKKGMSNEELPYIQGGVEGTQEVLIECVVV